MDASPLKQPSAIAPMIMSLIALGIVLGHYAVYGIVHDADEGTPAHLFQLLMVIQIPIIAVFAFKWLPRAPRPALLVLGLQALGIVAAFTSVYFLT